MRRVLEGGEGVISGGTLVRSSDRFILFLVDERRLGVGVWSGVSDEADDGAVILAASGVEWVRMVVAREDGERQLYGWMR
jgi:hypothetical protein